jgi:hypothetical protein
VQGSSSREDTSAAFGLDDPKATLTVNINGQPTVFNVGGETFGAKDRYVGTGDRVFLVEVNSSGRRAMWTDENRDDRGADYYALQGTPDQAVETTKKPPKTTPPAGSPAPSTIGAWSS